jgi:alpha-galactosidase
LCGFAQKRFQNRFRSAPPTEILAGMLHNLRATLLTLAAVVLISLPAIAHQPGIANQTKIDSASDLRTPPPAPTPHLNGPKVYGVRPGHPFLYRIPCTGTRPIRFSARRLPHSLRLDRETGIISGIAPDQPGAHLVTLEASNSLGRDQRAFNIVVGQTIGLTPQMGWNDWYSYYEHVTEKDIRTAAAAMISSGMADFGYQFVDIDDAWARKPSSPDPEINGVPRDDQGNILPSERFPDMGGLTAYIHSLGLKAGIYTSPGPLTCAHFEGSYGHERADAKQFAAWGFDLLKYDWCTYGRIAKDKSLAELQKPYVLMGGLVRNLPRDMVLNMCQYGMGDVWNWGREVGGNSWRTTGDLGAEKGDSLPGFYKIGFANAEHFADAGPGGWNDPDYILIGTVGDAHHIDLPGKPTSLTHEEQYSYMSMWALMASPLIFSGQMDRLDPFTLNVLCNSEVIDVDQDSLGKQASIVRKTDAEFVLDKPLEDGAHAVGLFNLTEEPRSMTLNWSQIGFAGPKNVRDVWRQVNLGAFAQEYSAVVPPHGVILVRVTPAGSKR